MLNILLFCLFQSTASLPFSRKHPMACWLSCMLSIFAGTVLSNFLLGEPIIGALKNANQLHLATVVW